MKRDRWLLIGIVLLAAGLRLWAIGDLPPGLFHDEAAEGIDALRILQDGARPIFLPSNNGREPLFAYVVAGMFALVGPGALGIRLAAVLLGLLTVPATYFWARALFGGRVGLLAALLLALSPWHLHLSRLGVRPVALPLVEALAFGLLWLAYRRGRPLYWLAAGIALGLTLYTYMPARVLLPLAAVPLAATVLRPGPAVRRLLGPALLLIGLAATSTPLGFYFWQHPEDLVDRAQQVSVMNAIRAGADPGTVLEENVKATAGMFLEQGDANPRHNLPGRPIFDPFLAAAALLGLALAASRLRRMEYTLLLLWLIAALGPAIISDSAPHFLRAAGLLPALLVLPAVALAWGWERVQVRKGRPQWAYAGIVAAGMLYSGGGVVRDYFFLWPPVAAPSFQIDRVALLSYELGRPSPARLYYATREPGDPLLALLARRPLVPFHPDSVPFPAKAETGSAYLLPCSEAELAKTIQVHLPGTTVEGTGGACPGTILRPAAGAVPSISGAPVAGFGGQLQASRLSLSPEVRAGDEIAFGLLWQVVSPPTEDYALFTHLLGPDGEVWRQTGGPLGLGILGTSRWPDGETVVEQRRIGVPGDALPGQYRLVIGIDAPADGRRLTAISPDGRGLGTAVTLGTVQVTKGPGQPNLALLPIQKRLAGTFDAPIRLLGLNIGLDPVRQGDEVSLVLFWQATTQPGADYQMRLRLVDAAGRIVAEQAGPPGGGRHPTGRWQEGEAVRDYRKLLVPAAVPPGRHALQVELIEGERALGPAVRLGSVEVRERPRQFAVPAMQHRLDVDFGAGARLLGYDLEPASPRPGEAMRLTLYWQGRAPMATSYTVFAHLLDTGQKVVAQHDGPPLAGASPTTAWVTDEVASDAHELALPKDLPPGRYQLEVGMYDAATGERLPVSAGTTLARAADTAGRRALLDEVEVLP